MGNCGNVRIAGTNSREDIPNGGDKNFLLELKRAELRAVGLPNQFKIQVPKEMNLLPRSGSVVARSIRNTRYDDIVVPRARALLRRTTAAPRAASCTGRARGQVREYIA